MAEKRQGISVFLSYVLGLVWSVALMICLVAGMRISGLVLAGALLVTGAIVLVIKRIGGRIYHSRWFTLVVIFTVLGVPVVPGFRDASPRGKTSMVLSHMRGLADALESYRADYNAYPPACDNTGRVVPPNASGVSAGYLSLIPTTPRTYAPAIPLDPFNKRKEAGKTVNQPYRYATNGSTCWIITSVGADGREDIRIEDFCDPQKGDCDVSKFLSRPGIGIAVMYDVTNGTTSSGDIVRFGP
jgi:hypothetical protein